MFAADTATAGTTDPVDTITEADDDHQDQVPGYLDHLLSDPATMGFVLVMIAAKLFRAMREDRDHLPGQHHEHAGHGPRVQLPATHQVTPLHSLGTRIRNYRASLTVASVAAHVMANIPDNPGVQEWRIFRLIQGDTMRSGGPATVIRGSREGAGPGRDPPRATSANG
jgi:hypothetical protein